MVVHIVYASQTGTSEDVALQLSFRLQKISVPSVVLSAENLSIQNLLQFQYILFFVSTTGEGDPPDSLLPLWETLMDNSLPSSCLHQLHFAVFGFGDTKYGELFNVVARKLQRRLFILGAIQIVERGLGDYQDPLGYRNEYQDWQKRVFEYCKANHKQVCLQQSSISQVKEIEKQEFAVIEKRLVSPVSFGRTTFCIEMLLPPGHIPYKPGNVLEVYPENPQTQVAELIKYFNIAPETRLQYRYLTNIDALSLFTEYLNLSDTVPFILFDQLHKYCADPIHAEKLKEIGSNYGQYNEYARKYRKNILQIIKDFPDLKIPLKYFLEKINQNKARKYSIASYDDSTLTLLLRLVQYNVDNKLIRGIASNYLYSCDFGSKVKGRILPDRFQAAEGEKYFCVGVGTGIAPFISFADYAKHTGQEEGVYIVFGTKSAEEHFQKEKLQNLQEGGYMRVSVAYSQTEPKMHVQDLLRSQKTDIRSFIQKKQARIMICGPNQTFIENIIQIVRAQVLEIDKETIKNYRRDRRIIVEYW